MRGVEWERERREKCALRKEKQRVPALPGREIGRFAAYDASCARILLLWKPKTQTMTSTTPYIRGMSD
jgi:hypothetical protein